MMVRPLTMKILHGEFEGLRRFVQRAVVGFALVAVGAGIAGGVFLARTSSESHRTCGAIDAVVDYLFDKAPTTRSLPARTPDQQKAFEQYRADLRDGINEACGG